VWSYDFLEERTHDGRKFRMLNIIDEFTHECLAIRVSRRLKSIDVIDLLSDLFILRGVPEFIRSDNGPEFVAQAVQDWIGAVGSKTAYISPGSPWENGFIESFNARWRDELLDGTRPRSSSRVGDGTTTWSGRMPRSATGLRPRSCSCQRSPHGRLRNPDQLRQPCSRWCQDRP
jgi:transposase InsO family protein